METRHVSREVRTEFLKSQTEAKRRQISQIKRKYILYIKPIKVHDVM